MSALQSGAELGGGEAVDGFEPSGRSGVRLLAGRVQLCKRSADTDEPMKCYYCLRVGKSRKAVTLVKGTALCGRCAKGIYDSQAIG